jgi:hypothetical protein
MDGSKSIFLGVRLRLTVRLKTAVSASVRRSLMYALASING